MIDATTRVLDNILGMIGRTAALLVLLIIGLLVFEMIARGLFGYSFPWAHELSTWLATALVFLGGPYALIRGHFVRVDIIYASMSVRTRAIVDSAVATPLVILFVGTLIWYGGELFLSSFAMGERSATGAWAGPVWAAKIMVPLGGFLLLLAWFSHLLRLWHEALYGPLPVTPGAERAALDDDKAGM